MKDMKRVNSKSLLLLIAEDDPDDRLIIKEALEESVFSFQYHFVVDGEELLNFLMSGLVEGSETTYTLPALILLDLNLPKKDGRKALCEIKEDPVLRKIPVIVLTTSNNPEDIINSYESGANSYIVKPEDYASMLDIMKTLEEYWFKVSKLP